MRPLFDFGNGSAARVFGIPVYGGSSKTRWHRLFVRPLFRAGNRVHNLAWAFRSRFVPRHRHDLIRTGLRPGWHDADELMLHGMFALLCRYVEAEMGGVEAVEAHAADLRGTEGDDPEWAAASERQASQEAEAAALYRWWKSDYPAMKERRDVLMAELFGGDRVSFSPVEGTDLHRMEFRPFEGGEEAKHAELRGLEERIDREEQEMLHRLVEIRRGLWT